MRSAPASFATLDDHVGGISVRLDRPAVSPCRSASPAPCRGFSGASSSSPGSTSPCPPSRPTRWDCGADDDQTLRSGLLRELDRAVERSIAGLRAVVADNDGLHGRSFRRRPFVLRWASNLLLAWLYESSPRRPVIGAVADPPCGNPRRLDQVASPRPRVGCARTAGGRADRPAVLHRLRLLGSGCVLASPRGSRGEFRRRSHLSDASGAHVAAQLRRSRRCSRTGRRNRSRAA